MILAQFLDSQNVLILDSELFIKDLEFWIPGSDLRILDPNSGFQILEEF